MRYGVQEETDPSQFTPKNIFIDADFVAQGHERVSFGTTKILGRLLCVSLNTFLIDSPIVCNF